MIISSATDQGRRPAQEDRFFTHENDAGTLLAVADGVNGSQTATLALEQLYGIFYRRALMWRRYHEVFLHVFKELSLLTEKETSGAAISAVWVPRHFSFASVAVLGNCPVYIYGEKSRLWTSPTHDVNYSKEELMAATGRGAIRIGDCIAIERHGGAAIQLSRMLGYRDLAPILNRRPQVTKVPLEKRGAILLATDGLRLSKTEIQDYLAQGYSAQQILEQSLAHDNDDNTTVIVCRQLAPRPKKIE